MAFVTPTSDSILKIGVSVREKGHLVAFPTETVYGLGANALDKSAVLRIFEAKGRPLTDPVICHVACVKDALSLYNCQDSPLESAVITCLAKQFWPGPLSIVARAAPHVLPELTAYTGFVSVRCPNNAIALELIKAAKVPIAAPSANRFGHISPSCAAHVVKDFKTLQLKDFPSQTELLVLDGGPCDIGIESTVCKVEYRKDHGCLVITILRHGHISKPMIEATLESNAASVEEALSDQTDIAALRSCTVRVSEKISYISDDTEAPAPSSSQQGLAEILPLPSSTVINVQQQENEEPMCSPGMLLTHYAPSIPTFLLQRPETMINHSNIQVSVELPPSTEITDHISCNNASNHCDQIPLSDCVILDAFGFYDAYMGQSAGYFNLGSSSNVLADATVVDTMQHDLFRQLHNAEDCAVKTGRKTIICIHDFKKEAQMLGEPALAIYDRLYRSASGRIARLLT